MRFLTGLMSLRNVAILAGLLGAAFLAQSVRIKYKSSKIEKLEFELLTTTQDLNKTLEANASNQSAINALRLNLQQCVYMRELNETSALAELQTNQRRIAELKNDYEDLRKKYQAPKIGACIEPTIDADIIQLLEQARSGQN